MRLVFVFLLLASVAHAQPAARPADDARAVAAVVLSRLGGEQMVDQILATQRQATINGLLGAGQSPDQAALVFESYFKAEYAGRRPELTAWLQDVLIADFTLPELRALEARRDGDAWRSAQTKLGALNGHMTDAARRWTAQVGADAIQKNRDELRKLGLNIAGGAK